MKPGVLLLFLVLCLQAGQTFAQPAENRVAAATVHGPVTLQVAAMTVPLEAGMSIPDKGVVASGEGGHSELRNAAGAWLRLGENSAFYLYEADSEGMRGVLGSGNAYLHGGASVAQILRVNTHSFKIFLHGAEAYVSQGGTREFVCAISGPVSIQGMDGGSTSLSVPGQCLGFGAGGVRGFALDMVDLNAAVNATSMPGTGATRAETSAAETHSPQNPSPDRRWTVSLATYAERSNAQAHAARADHADQPLSVVQAKSGGKSVFRVLSGRYASVGEAKTAAARMGEQHPGAWALRLD